jgi:hypothetical protein
LILKIQTNREFNNLLHTCGIEDGSEADAGVFENERGS